MSILRWRGPSLTKIGPLIGCFWGPPVIHSFSLASNFGAFVMTWNYWVARNNLIDILALNILMPRIIYSLFNYLWYLLMLGDGQCITFLRMQETTWTRKKMHNYLAFWSHFPKFLHNQETLQHWYYSDFTSGFFKNKYFSLVSVKGRHLNKRQISKT